MEPAAVRLLDGGTHLPVPASFGWDGFHIILPRQAAQQFSAHELELLFLHELIHLKRRDHWWKLLAGLSSAMWWFNPFVRWAEYRLTAATELEVDRRVLATAAAGRDQAADYARMLLAFHTPSGNTPALSGLSFHGRELKKRIQDILMNKKRNRCWSYGVILLAILAVMTTVWLAPGITTIATHTEVRNQVPSFAKLACYLDVEKLLASEFYPELSHIGQNNGMIGRVQKMFSLLLYPKVWEEAGFQEILAFVKALDTPNFYGGFVIRCDMPWATLRQKIADCNPQAREISINGLTTLEITPQNPDGTTASNVFILWPLSDSGSFALVEKSLLKAYRDELAVGFTARKELAGQLDDVPPDAVFFLIMTNTMPGFDALYNINVCLRNKLEFSAHVADPLEHRQISKEIANDRTRLEQQLGTKLPHFKLYVKDSYDYLFHWAIDKKQLLSLAAIVTEKRPNNTPTTIN